MNLRACLLTLAAAVASVVINLVVVDTWLLYPWWVVAPGLAVLAVALGVRRNRPERLAPWAVLLAAMGIMWAGWSLSAWVGSGVWHVHHHATVALVRDVLYLIAYPMLGVASLMMVRARTGGRDRDNVIDALIVMVALATTLGAWLFGSTSFPAAATSTDRLVVSVAPLLMAAVVTASLRLLMADANRIPAAWLIFTAGVATLIGNVWTAQLLRAGLPTVHVGIDVLWVLAFVLLGAAVLHPSMRHLTEPVPPDALIQGMPVDRLVLLGAALLSAPFAHLRMSGGESAETLQVVAGGTLVAVLAVWRVSRLLRERDRARHALVEAASRDAMIGTIGQWAIGSRTTWELLADVDEALADGLPGLACSVVPIGVGAPDAVPVATRLDVGQSQSVPVDDGTGTIAHVTATFAAGRADLAGDRAFLVAVASLLSTAARRRADETRLRHDVLHDPLTGLPNRTLALDRLEQLLARRDQDVAVLFLDLDGFKSVNDTLGHEAGDAILRDVAARLRSAVRSDDTVARFAGDEFVVVSATADPIGLSTLADRVIAAATVEVDDGGRTMRVGASIGVATAASGSITVDDLLQRADTAMYRAKRRGGRVVAWADDAPAVEARRDEGGGPAAIMEVFAATP